MNDLTNDLTLKVLDVLDHYRPAEEARTLSAELALGDPQTQRQCAALTLNEGRRLLGTLPHAVQPMFARLLSGLHAELSACPQPAPQVQPSTDRRMSA